MINTCASPLDCHQRQRIVVQHFSRLRDDGWKPELQKQVRGYYTYTIVSV